MIAFDMLWYHSPAPSERGPYPPKVTVFSKPWYMFLFFYFNEHKILGIVVSVQINGKWKALASMWGRKKPLYFYCIVCATISNSWISHSRVIGCISTLRDQIKIPLCIFWFGNASCSLNQAFEHTRLEKCNNIFPLCSVNWYFITQKLFPLILLLAEALLTNEKGKLWLLI